jgi:hypothetical protein
MESYVDQPGDTLWNIYVKLFGDGNKYRGSPQQVEYPEGLTGSGSQMVMFVICLLCVIWLVHIFVWVV